MDKRKLQPPIIRQGTPEISWKSFTIKNMLVLGEAINKVFKSGLDVPEEKEQIWELIDKLETFLIKPPKEFVFALVEAVYDFRFQRNVEGLYDACLLVQFDENFQSLDKERMKSFIDYLCPYIKLYDPWPMEVRERLAEKLASHLPEIIAKIEKKIN